MEDGFRQPEFLERVILTRQQLDELLPFDDSKKMEQLKTVGEWSLKDVAAHIVWHEMQMVGLIRERALEGSPLWDRPLHERNQAIYEEYRESPLEDVRREYEDVFPMLAALIDDLSTEELNDPSLWQGMMPEWMPGTIIAENTYEHYEDHIRDIRSAA